MENKMVCDCGKIKGQDEYCPDCGSYYGICCMDAVCIGRVEGECPT